MPNLTFFDHQRDLLMSKLFGDPLPNDGIPQPLMEHGGSPFGGGNLQSESDRYAEVAGRGGAPLTLGGLTAAFGNAMAITDPVTAGLMSMSELAAGVTPGTFGGFANIPGHYAIPGTPRTIAEYNAARERARRSAEVGRALSSSGLQAASARGVAFHGGRRQDSGGGGFGGSYGAGDRTSKGPGGQLGHI